MAIHRSQEKIEKLTEELVSLEKDNPIRDVVNVSLRKELDHKSELQSNLELLNKEQNGIRNSLEYPDSIAYAFVNLEELQSNITEPEKTMIISTVLKKITLSCKKKINNFKRLMTLQIQAMPEYISIIPKTKFVFEIDTSSGRSLWRITSPFELDSAELIRHKLRKEPLCKEKHFLHDIIALKNEFELSKLSMRKFSEFKKVDTSTISLKLGLLKKLSKETKKFILALNGGKIIQRITLRKLREISTIPKDQQLPNLKAFLDQFK